MGTTLRLRQARAATSSQTRDCGKPATAANSRRRQGRKLATAANSRRRQTDNGDRVASSRLRQARDCGKLTTAASSRLRQAHDCGKLRTATESQAREAGKSATWMGTLRARVRTPSLENYRSGVPSGARHRNRYFGKEEAARTSHFPRSASIDDNNSSSRS